MARELDPQQLQCPVHGRLAVAFGTRVGIPAGTEGPWFPWCPVELDLYGDRDAYFYVRFRTDPDDDLKSAPDPADNHR